MQIVQLMRSDSPRHPIAAADRHGLEIYVRCICPDFPALILDRFVFLILTQFQWLQYLETTEFDGKKHFYLFRSCIAYHEFTEHALLAFTHSTQKDGSLEELIQRLDLFSGL